MELINVALHISLVLALCLPPKRYKQKVDAWQLMNKFHILGMTTSLYSLQMRIHYLEPIAYCPLPAGTPATGPSGSGPPSKGTLRAEPARTGTSKHEGGTPAAAAAAVVLVLVVCDMGHPGQFRLYTHIIYIYAYVHIWYNKTVIHEQKFTYTFPYQTLLMCVWIYHVVYTYCFVCWWTGIRKITTTLDIFTYIFPYQTLLMCVWI